MILPVSYGEVTYYRMAKTYAGRALYWTGVYFVDGLLIDSGPPNMHREAAVLFRDLEVRQCVASHHHEDHSGNLGILSDVLHVVPAAHARAVERIANPLRHPPLYRRMAWGVPTASQTKIVGQRLETPAFQFEVLHTPGHSDDHIALYERNRQWLFSGDLYLGPRLRYLRADEDVHSLIDSLRRVIALEPRTMFCQHRGRVENATAQLRRKLDSLTELGERIAGMRERGLTEQAITRTLPGSDLAWRLWTGGDFSKRNFVRAFLKRYDVS